MMAITTAISVDRRIGLEIEKYRSQYGYPNYRYGAHNLTHWEKWLKDNQFDESKDELNEPKESS
eukprot:CAMPEP_0201573242 /NCGR_PEP_ID=MMETSP0190_2-20130828/16986_1 /ASSEMBLY_ACC=CAM_ASM_000263 /TAXON_ID=37353 /ORGANISM="Rosalina sp." /LENGTH=63 /DNA_ID=CAMNT_0047999969 /DNA_START=11 /DNA_END=199 /DNA_ORIENTATION=+